MKKATASILNKLSEQGYRVTRAREEVVSTLLNVQDSLSVQELVKKTAADEASVYRTIGLLKELGLLEVIATQGGNKRYALAGDHHHHVVCQRCETVEHVPCNHKLPKPKTKKFKDITDHEVTFYGLCVNCS